MDYEQILNALLKSGKITESDVFEADNHIDSPGRRMIVERIHLACCNKDHDSGECEWYEEEQGSKKGSGGAVRWSQPAHVQWTNTVLNIRRRLQISWDELDGLSRVISEGKLSKRSLSLLPELLNLGPEFITEDSTSSGDDG